MSLPSDDQMGRAMHDMVRGLFPICRSLTGDGFRRSLRLLAQHNPIKIHEVPSGTRVFDWTVPREWNIRDAYVQAESGEKIIDFKNSNLHVVGYSTPIDRWVDREELDQHLHSLETQPDAIPYVTSYYKEYWGFCLPHNQRRRLGPGRYRVVIDSTLKKGSLTYGELLIKGASREEVFLSTYLCHPSMANNELSGPVVTTFLAQWIRQRPRRYSYRVVFIPETIGSLTYLSRHLRTLKQNVVAGFNITCVGDNRAYSYLPSRQGNTLADRVALRVLESEHPGFVRYTYLDRGSDERQYCSPGADLPVATVIRSKYGAYPEYHTSLDNLDFVTPEGLWGGYSVIKACLEGLEQNRYYRTLQPGEPQLGKRGLYTPFAVKGLTPEVAELRNFLAYADGAVDLIDLSVKINVPLRRLYPIVERLRDAQLIREVRQKKP